MLKILGNKREVASDGLPVGSLCARGGEVFLVAYGNLLVNLSNPKQPWLNSNVFVTPLRAGTRIEYESEV